MSKDSMHIDDFFHHKMNSFQVWLMGASEALKESFPEKLDLINEYWGKQKVTLATRQTEYQKQIAV